MIALSLSLLLAPQNSANDVAEFYFLKSGVKRTYVSTTNGDELETIDEVKTMELIGSETVYPVITWLGGTQADKSYYAVKEDGLYIVADWDKKAIDPPMPVLKVGNSEMKWSWKSGTMQLEYTSKPGKNRKVFGKDLPTIEFRAVGRNGNDDLAANVDQTAIYAKGVGMVEMTEIASTKKTKTTRTVKLTKITGGGW